MRFRAVTLLRGLSALTQRSRSASVCRRLLPCSTVRNSLRGQSGKDSEASAIPTRFVLWFNGNGIPEKYWIPLETGPRFHDDAVPVSAGAVSQRYSRHHGLDNPAARLPGPGNDHHRSMSALVSGTQFTGRGAGGPSIDQAIAAQDRRRFAIPLAADRCVPGVVRREHSAQYELGGLRSRAAAGDAAEQAVRPPFRRAWTRAGSIARSSILDAVQEDAARCARRSDATIRCASKSTCASIRDVERAIASLPPEYRSVDPPEADGDMKDWPQDLAGCRAICWCMLSPRGQTRVASYMLTKCQGLSRFPWLGYTAARHHDYTHARRQGSGSDGADGQRIMRDICRWHVEEFAYLIGKLKSTPEGDGNVLDRPAWSTSTSMPKRTITRTTGFP